LRDAAPSARVVIYSGKESSRRWYERQGAQFFGKATDRLDALFDGCGIEADRVGG
jgi:hypothetical protein